MPCRSAARQPLFGKAPCAVEGAVDADEVFFGFCGSQVSHHALARFEGDFCGFDAERVGYSCCCGYGCQQVHGCCHQRSECKRSCFVRLSEGHLYRSDDQ